MKYLSIQILSLSWLIVGHYVAQGDGINSFRELVSRQCMFLMQNQNPQDSSSNNGKSKPIQSSPSERKTKTRVENNQIMGKSDKAQQILATLLLYAHSIEEPKQYSPSAQKNSESNSSPPSVNQNTMVSIPKNQYPSIQHLVKTENNAGDISEISLYIDQLNRLLADTQGETSTKEIDLEEPSLIRLSNENLQQLVNKIGKLEKNSQVNKNNSPKTTKFLPIAISAISLAVNFEKIKDCFSKNSICLYAKEIFYQWGTDIAQQLNHVLSSVTPEEAVGTITSTILLSYLYKKNFRNPSSDKSSEKLNATQLKEILIELYDMLKIVHLNSQSVINQKSLLEAETEDNIEYSLFKLNLHLVTDIVTDNEEPTAASSRTTTSIPLEFNTIIKWKGADGPAVYLMTQKSKVL